MPLTQGRDKSGPHSATLCWLRSTYVPIPARHMLPYPPVRIYLRIRSCGGGFWGRLCFTPVPARCQKSVPAQLTLLGAWLLCQPNGHVGHVLHCPVEVEGSQ